MKYKTSVASVIERVIKSLREQATLLAFKCLLTKEERIPPTDMASGVRAELETFAEPSRAFLREDLKENQR